MTDTPILNAQKELHDLYGVCQITGKIFADPSREENNANSGSNGFSNRSKPDLGKIINVNSKAPQNGLNEDSKAQSVAMTAAYVEKKRKKY